MAGAKGSFSGQDIIKACGFRANSREAHALVALFMSMEEDIDSNDPEDKEIIRTLKAIFKGSVLGKALQVLNPKG